MVYDFIIIGAGPIGLACGIEAIKGGFSYLIVDKGCLVNSIYNYPLNMTFFSTSEKLEIGDVPFVSYNNKPIRSEALEYYRRVSMKWKLNFQLYNKVLQANWISDRFKIETEKGILFSKYIIVASGFFDKPNLTGIPGEVLSKVHHYYKEAHPYFGKKITVIGAANSAVDVALECYRKNADVTMVIKDSKISDRVKYWVKPDIDNRIAEGSIKAYFNSSVVQILEKEIIVENADGKFLVENDFVLAMTGYLPDFNFLKNLGVKLKDDGSQTPEYNDKSMETNVPNLYLAGVISGGENTHKWFIENSRIHAEFIIQHVIGKINKN